MGDRYAQDANDVLHQMPWRIGRSIGRTIYACPPGSSPRDGEVVIGMMDTPELAAHIVEIHNVYLELYLAQRNDSTAPP